jgi:DNA-binding transcriptional MocR family regulator
MPAPWTARVWAEYRAANLTRAWRDVLLTLATYRGPGGFAWPSHATLAERAKCSVRTVQRALAMAAELGLVAWTERRVRAGWRWLRTSNAYRLLTPLDAVRAGLRTAWKPAPATTGQDGRRGESLSKKEALRTMLQAAAAMPDLLTMRRAVIEGRMAAAGRS